jgi:hypothetical protein
MRLGTSAVPVIATLSARPVLGATCNSTSAWGSALVMQASVTARMQANSKIISAYSVTAWRNELPPWQALHLTNTLLYVNPDALRTGYTVAQLFSDVGVPSASFVGEEKVHRILLADGTSGIANLPFKKRILVAKLNHRIDNLTAVGQCVSAQQIRDMGSLNFAPANGGPVWDRTAVRSYLENNYIAW